MQPGGPGANKLVVIVSHKRASMQGKVQRVGSGQVGLSLRFGDT